MTTTNPNRMPRFDTPNLTTRFLNLVREHARTPAHVDTMVEALNAANVLAPLSKITKPELDLFESAVQQGALSNLVDDVKYRAALELRLIQLEKAAKPAPPPPTFF
jgi:hypothetical protein